MTYKHMECITGHDLQTYGMYNMTWLTYYYMILHTLNVNWEEQCKKHMVNIIYCACPKSLIFYAFIRPSYKIYARETLSSSLNKDS